MNNPTQNLPEPGLYEHQYGGLYRVLGVAEHTEDTASEPLVIYEHVWPYPPGNLKARPASAWESRFRQISEATLQTAMNRDRMEAQAAVAHAKQNKLKFGETGQTYNTYY